MNPPVAGSEIGGVVLVTGATGFLGRDVVHRLLASRTSAGAPAVEVHVLARSAERPAALLSDAIRWHRGDIRDPGAVDAAVAAVAGRASELSSVARIVHSAALISYRTRDRDEARATNVEGTRHLVEAAKRHAIARFLFVSSVVTVGHSVAGELVDERAPFNNGELGVDYTNTKRAAEELVLAAARELDVVVVNPGAIFGPVERESNTLRFIVRISRGKAPWFAPPGGIGVVGVHDVTSGLLLALARGRRGERYLLVESNLSTLELFAMIAREVGVAPVRHALPSPIWTCVVAGASVWDRVFPLRLAPPQALRMLGVELALDSRKARTELGWSPRPFDQVLRETVDHLRAQGLVPPREA